MKKTILYTVAAAAMVIVGCNDNAGDVSENLERFLGSFGAPRTLAVRADPPEGGRVSRDPDKETYTPYEQVTATAEPYDHYTFTNWSGASNSASASAEIVMDKDKELTAHFRRNTTYTLTTTANPPEGGEVRRYPDKETYNPNEQVTLRIITYEEHYKFNGWSGASESTDGEVSIIMDSDKWVTANFQQNRYTLTTTANPPGSGEVRRDPDKETYSPNEQVTVRVIPDEHYRFNGWSGASVSTDGEVSIIMDSDKRVTANFTQITQIRFTDGRDNTTYKVVTIGGKRWMAENLNYATGNSSWCYNNNNFYCNTYGRLYDWTTAMQACPSGWHLPSRSEWTDLVTAVGSPAGTKLKSTSGWSSGSVWGSGNGTDDFGFSALPGGYWSSDGAFHSVGTYGYWWTATEYSSSIAYNRYIRSEFQNVVEYDNYKSNGFSVRCVSD